MTAEVRALWITWRAAWRHALADRRALWSQLVMMTTNDLVWIAFWLLVFSRVDEIRGWKTADVLILLAIAITSSGFVLGALHNVRRLGDMAADGELDEALTVPVRTLPYLLVRRVEVLHIGEPLFGLVMLIVFADLTPARLAVFAYGVAMAIVIQVGFFVLVGSLSFFVGRNEGGNLGLQAMLLFSSYPVDAFGGVAKILLYVVVPSAFVTSVPARLVGSFELGPALALAAVAAVFAGLGVLTFDRGLRRYTSGSTWT
ncbi:MAG: ABC-2 family transporter protein [Actinomycetota bacterium]